MVTRPRIVALGLTVIVSLFVPAAMVSAQQASPAGCDGTSSVGFPTGGSARIRSNVKTFFDVAVPAIPAGTYDIDTVTYDGYPTRINKSQDFEQLRLQFLDAGGVLIDETAVTPDLADNVLFADWKGSVGQIVLDRPAVVIRANHAFPGPGSPNSLSPACVGWTFVPPATTSTTTVPPTTEPPAPTTTLVQPPSSTSVPPSTTVAPTTTVVPTTTVAPTTTTVPTQVLPEVQEMPDPEPIVGNPSFTG